MRIHSEPRYILALTVTFLSPEPAESFHVELASNPDVYGLKCEGRVVKYHTFSKDSAMALAKDFESRWIAQQAAPPVESKTIQSSGAGMIRYGGDPGDEQPSDEIHESIQLVKSVLYSPSE